MISPASIPAFSAGLSSWTFATNAPLLSFKSKLSAISSVTPWICTPSHPLLVLPNSFNWSTIFTALLEGIVKSKRKGGKKNGTKKGGARKGQPKGSRLAYDDTKKGKKGKK